MGALAEAAARVRSGDASSAELVAGALRRARASSLNGFTVLLDEAERIAKDADAVPPERRGPLHGVPVAVKDLFDVAGVATTSACAAYAGNVASTDAEAVHRLRAAGAVMVGKTNQHELAFGGTSVVSAFGPVRNPWDPDRITGGSSGGSAAVVAGGIVPGALGSDTGGSIRIPSSFCGTTGLKPTHGAVSIRGAMPLNPWLDTAGPIAGDATDARLLFQAVAGFDPDDPWSLRAQEVFLGRSRIGIVTGAPFEPVTGEVRTALDAAALVLTGGTPPQPVAIPGVEGSRAWWLTVTLAEFGKVHAAVRDRDDLDPFFRAMLDAAAAVRLDDYLAARDHIAALRTTFRRVFDEVDLLLAPATVFPAPRADQGEVVIAGERIDIEVGGCARATFPANLAGIPAIAFPIGFTDGGLPVGGQLMGPWWSEPRLLDAVERYQGKTGWHMRFPA